MSATIRGVDLVTGYNSPTGYRTVPLRADHATGALQQVPYEHHQVHEGDSYYVQYSVASLGAMTTPDDMITLTFKTPNTTTWSHFQFGATGTPGWLLTVTEAYTGGAASPTGTLAILNKNRNSSHTSTITNGTTAGLVSYDATAATGGTVLWSEYLAGSTSPKSAGITSSGRDELVLKQNTVYQVSLYGTDTNPATLFINWYEHANNA